MICCCLFTQKSGPVQLFGFPKQVELQVTLAQIGDSGQSLTADSAKQRDYRPDSIWLCLEIGLAPNWQLYTKNPWKPWDVSDETTSIQHLQVPPKVFFFASHPSHLSHPTSYPSYQLMDPSSAPYFDSLKNVGAIQNRWCFFSHDNGWISTTFQGPPTWSPWAPGPSATSLRQRLPRWHFDSDAAVHSAAAWRFRSWKVGRAQCSLVFGRLFGCTTGRGLVKVWQILLEKIQAGLTWFD